MSDRYEANENVEDYGDAANNLKHFRGEMHVDAQSQWSTAGRLSCGGVAIVSPSAEPPQLTRQRRPEPYHNQDILFVASLHKSYASFG